MKGKETTVKVTKLLFRNSIEFEVMELAAEVGAEVEPCPSATPEDWLEVYNEIAYMANYPEARFID